MLSSISARVSLTWNELPSGQTELNISVALPNSSISLLELKLHLDTQFS